MKPGTTLKQRDLVLVPIPYTDLKSKKKRPVIVLSNDDYNKRTDDLLVVGVTSSIQEKEYSVPLARKDMEEGELLRDSEIRADKIYSLSQGIVTKRFGRVNEDTYNKIIERISALLRSSSRE